jgi:hypothetical protein
MAASKTFFNMIILHFIKSGTMQKSPRLKGFLVPKTGLEPVRCCHRGILSPVRLPIPPLRHNRTKKRNWRRHPDLNWGIRVLQTLALPLGYGAIPALENRGIQSIYMPVIVPLFFKEHSQKWSGRRDSNPRLRPWQGRTLPLSHSRMGRLDATSYNRI